LKNDALSGVDLLRQRFDRVGALGHSEGGTISLMLGAEDKVDFIVSLAAMVVSGKETLLDQNRYLLSDAGFEQGVVEEYCTLLAGAFGGDGTVSSRIETSGLPAELKRNLQAALMQLNTPYIRYFLGLDVRDRLGLIRCPVLALNGTKDTQVSCENNLDVLRKGLPSVSENQILPLEDLNHLMQHSITGSPNEYSTITETISPSLLTLIPEWINGIR
ncbi:MAG: alpha/beta hydrolase, partial [Duncaniella sp.]|nr:alpha/beta hydrolase [Duncaniella sp.]